MITDLRNVMRYGTLVRCFLAEESKRITASTFKVFIPSLMSSIENKEEDFNENMDIGRILNEDDSYPKVEITIGSFLEAKSSHNYMHRLDGWIPEYKTAKSTYETFKSNNGSISQISASSTKGETDDIPQHPVMPISKPLKLNDNSLEDITFNTNVSEIMVHTNSTEVDFQELNRYFIRRGHPMIGVFLEGEEFEFRILSIDGATPYLDEIKDKGQGVNNDNPFNFVTP